MRKIRLAVVAVTLIAGASPPSKTAVQAASAARPNCCYTNPQYAGVCLVQAADGETCASIRAYLNDPKSVGKTYCESTTIRGRWRLVKCANR